MGDLPRSGARRLAFAVALLASAAIYAYSLFGIAATGSTLRAATDRQAPDRPVPVSYERANDDCEEWTGEVRGVRL